MKTTIFKYPFELVDHGQSIDTIGSDVVHVGLDPIGRTCIWVRGERGTDSHGLRLWVIGTGDQFPEDMPEHAEHFGSFLQGPFVWHVYGVRYGSPTSYYVER